MPQKQEFVDIDAAAKELNVSRQTIYNLFERGVLRRFKRPGVRRVQIPAEDIEKAKEHAEG